jgi:hypothetical protein
MKVICFFRARLFLKAGYSDNSGRTGEGHLFFYWLRWQDHRPAAPRDRVTFYCTGPAPIARIRFGIIAVRPSRKDRNISPPTPGKTNIAFTRSLGVPEVKEISRVCPTALNGLWISLPEVDLAWVYGFLMQVPGR